MRILIFLLSLSIGIVVTAQVRYTGSNLGVGTTSPSSALNIYGATDNIEITNTSETESGIVFNDAHAKSTQFAEILFNSGGTNDLVIYNQGMNKISIGPSFIRFNDAISVLNGSIYPKTPTTSASLGNGSSYAFNYLYAKTVYRTNEYSLSDEKVKDQIRPVEGALDIINRLNPVQYNLNDRAYFRNENANRKLPDHVKKKYEKQYGFIAQQVREILPQLVDQDTSVNLYYLNYEGIIPLLVSALQEQQYQIDRLDSLLKETKSKKESKASTTYLIQRSELKQNYSNPFTQSTRIDFYIQEDASSADLYVFDFNGNLEQSYIINTKGEGYIQIQGSSLTAGIYHYSLVVDGREIDTKKMILTE